MHCVSVRSIGLKGQAKVWNRLMDMSSKEDESDSLFSSPKLKGKNKDKLQLEALSLGKLEPKGNQMNVHANSIMYENISQILQSTVPPFSQLMASVVSNNGLHLSVHSFVNQQSELKTPSIILEKQNRNHNLVNPQINSLKNPGELKNAEVNMSSDVAKNDALDSGTNIQSSIDNTEPHEQIKEEISQYHFTLIPNTESKKLTTTIENNAKDQNKKSFSDHHIADEKIKDFKDQNHDINKFNSQHDDNEDKKIFLNEENKNTIDGNKNSLKQKLKISSSHNLNPETNEEKNENTDQEIDSPTDTNTLEDSENYSKSIHKDSLTDNEIPMEQNFFQNEIDYNRKGSDSSNKQQIGDETLQNHTVDVISSIYCTKPNIQSDKNFQNFTQRNNNFEQKRNNSAFDRFNMNEYATTVKPNITSPFVVPELPLNVSKNNISSKKEDERNSAQKVGDEIKGLSNSSEAKTSKKGKYENVQNEECVSLSETNTSLTNQTNVQTNHNLNKSLHSNDNNNTKENETSKPASNASETKVLPEESKISKVAGDSTTDECITIKLDNQPQPNVSNSFYSTFVNTTDVPTTSKFNRVSEPKTLNITSQETLISLKSTQAPRESMKGKLTNSKEHILMDQKEAVQKVSNLNPTLAVEEDGSKSQNSLYDEPEPVLKDLDKDDVDDNMADVLNNMIGMKHYRDKPTWTEKKGEDKKVTGTSKRDKVNTPKNIKHSLPSIVFAPNKEDLETNERPMKIKKTKKKIHSNFHTVEGSK